MERLVAAIIDSVSRILGRLRRFSSIKKILLMFFSYLVVAVVFGFIYYWMYTNNTNRFEFNSDIVKGRRIEIDLDTALQKKYINLMFDLQSKIVDEQIFYEVPIEHRHKRFREIVYNGYIRDHDFSFSITKNPSTNLLNITLTFEDTASGDTHRFYAPSSVSSPYLSTSDCERVLKILQSNDIKELLLTTEQYKKNVVWGVMDFQYFSFITLATVGYGDILPNSTEVRIIVIVEIILGLLITTFGLNLILTNPSP